LIIRIGSSGDGGAVTPVPAAPPPGSTDVLAGVHYRPGHSGETSAAA
jgi:hypothetical protein